MSENLDQDINVVSIVDDEGNEHLFEEIDRIELDDGRRYLALVPDMETNPEFYDDDDGDVIILKVIEEDGESYLIQIEDEAEFIEIGNIFEDRLIEKYESEGAAE